MRPFSVLAKAAAIATAAVARNQFKHKIRSIRRRRRRRYAVQSSKHGAFDERFSNSFKKISRQRGEQSFKRLFRKTRTAFHKLVLIITPHICRQYQSETEYRAATIPPDVRLAITLRRLSGPEVLDIALTYSNAIATVYDVIHDTVRALDIVLQFPKIPRSRRDLEKVARGFKLSRSQINPLDGCVGALDGMCNKIRQPPRERNPASFFVEKAIMLFQFRLYVTLTTFFICFWQMLWCHSRRACECSVWTHEGR